MTYDQNSSAEVRARALTKILDNASQSRDSLGGSISDLAAEGCAVMFVHPGSKYPADMRSVKVRRADDLAAQHAARAAGRSNWRKAKSPAGVALATTDESTLDGYLAPYVELHDDQPVNLAVSAGRSRLVVVDCDNPEQRAAFLRDTGADADTPPTVSTPGAHDTVGNLVHHDGGHYWFTAPEGVELPVHLHAMTVGSGDAAYSIKWGPNTYVLIPPSERAEGAYRLTGTVESLPESLAEVIGSYAAARPRADRPASRDDATTIEEWGAATPWSEILADADGWSATGTVDNCGCDVWTAPGAHASPKSATAHEPGCGRFADSPDPPLYIWTDHDAEPFTDLVAKHGRAVTRLRAVSALHSTATTAPPCVISICFPPRSPSTTRPPRTPP
ncbi:bifunctional DNA primase/polymerase [Gordonia sp. SL306]|uniref:bifunctional DNA primase/polymerase n=1 Tax=Gordonia sp. SL306 TaxID=2995145 RepID=UPI00226E948D|nr:bifunctional DNA primase/polymerase [Gordonia sp. SL306]WAC55172.1 bifunctional DNA primase/polymerase [Gordonia sp. SL306]